MSTRSNIGIENEDETVTVVYCHWDGYPMNNGAILMASYQDPERVRELLTHGDLVSLGLEIATCKFFKDKEDYSPAKTFSSRMAAWKNAEAFLYILTKKGWIFSERRSEFKPLTQHDVDPNSCAPNCPQCVYQRSKNNVSNRS